MTIRKQIVEADPRNARVITLLLGDYVKRGELLRQLGRPDAARAAIQEGLALADHLDESVPVTPDLAAAQAALRAQAQVHR